MRIGSVIVFLIVFLVAIFAGFGYLASDNIHTHQDLNSIRQYNDQLLRDMKAMQDQIGIVNSERAKLQDQVGQLDQSNIALENQVQNLQHENLSIKDQNAQLQGQLDQMIRLYPLAENLIGLLPQSLNLALLIPILPVSLAATFVIYRYKQRHNGRKQNLPTSSKRNITVKLTEKEMKEIIRIRRTR